MYVGALEYRKSACVGLANVEKAQIEWRLAIRPKGFAFKPDRVDG